MIDTAIYIVAVILFITSVLMFVLPVLYQPRYIPTRHSVPCGVKEVGPNSTHVSWKPLTRLHHLFKETVKWGRKRRIPAARQYAGPDDVTIKGGPILRAH